MSVDYIVASLPELSFSAPAPLSWEKFCEIVGGEDKAAALEERFSDLDAQLRNAIAEARGGADEARPAKGCSLFWRNKILACFQEKDVFKRETALDRVRWDAADELVACASPLGMGALAAYAVRLRIALRRSASSAEGGRVVFEKMMEATKTNFE